MEEHELKIAEDQDGFNSFMNNNQSPFRTNNNDGS